MQFLVTAYDGKDEDVLQRRLAARDEHLKGVEQMVKEKKHLYAAAILDDNEKMIGSVLIVDFTNREELDKWLKNEPYIKYNVWKEIDIKPCKVPPIFMKLHE